MQSKSSLRIYFGDAYYKFIGGWKKFWFAVSFFIYNGFLTHFPSFWLRIFYLRNILRIQIGERTSIHSGCFFSGNRIEIGHHSVVGRNSYLDGRVGKIVIMNNVSIAPEAYILSLTHDKDSPDFSLVAKDVVIEDYCWIGARVLILPGITLGRGVVIGAGSVVTKSVEPYDVLAGNPAKKIGIRKNELRYQLNYFPWFNTDI